MSTTTAYVFPGQGSQSVGMLGQLANRYPSILEPFARVSKRIGYDLWALVQQGPAATLNKTEYTQVAMLTADVALYQAFSNAGHARPSMMAGHSLGEYAALVCAEAISLEDAAVLVSKRGQLMQEAIPLGEGAMAAIVGLTDEQVQSICTQASTAQHQVTPANYNAIGQVVIAGHTKAVQDAIALAKASNALLAMEIPVSVPCHCPLLKHAATLFGEVLDKASFSTPALPVISNVDLSIYESPAQLKQLLQAQLYSPVRWVETINMMKTKGVYSIIECGPGKVLTGLIKRIDKSLKTSNVHEVLEAMV